MFELSTLSFSIGLYGINTDISYILCWIYISMYCILSHAIVWTLVLIGQLLYLIVDGKYILIQIYLILN